MVAYLLHRNVRYFWRLIFYVELIYISPIETLATKEGESPEPQG